MTTTTPSASRRLNRGFTLIELLVVVAIIAILAGLGFGAFQMAKNKAAEATAKAALADLISASDLFYDTYGYLPLSSGASTDELRKTDQDLMGVLVGLESGADENPQREQFFNGNKAKGKGKNSYNGLYRTEQEALLYGPWRLKQEDERLYRIIYDYDFQDGIREQEVGNETVFGYRQIAWSLGKDGKAGPGEENADNVYSWNRN